MRKVIRAAGYALLSYILVLIIGAAFPRYKEGMWLFFILMMLDGYVWTSVYPVLKKKSVSLRTGLTLLYWLPAILIIVLMVYGFIQPFSEWNIAFRTWTMTLILAGYLSMILPAAFLLVMDLIHTIRFFTARQGKRHVFRPDRMNLFLSAGWGISILAVFFFFYGILFGEYDFRVRQEKIALEDLPGSFRGMRIAQVSDIHLGSWSCRGQLEKAVEKINSLRPDVIFITGDLLNYTSRDSQGFEDILRKLRAREKIYIITGNHDYGLYVSMKSPEEAAVNMKMFFRQCDRLGWKLLLNDHDLLIRGTDTLAIVGVENWGKARRFPKFADLDKAVKGIETIRPKLLLAHDPAYWQGHVVNVHPDIGVTFSGHTHGGQVGMETPGHRFSLISSMSYHWAGWYDTLNNAGRHQYLYVNRGLGTILYPGRIGIWPEITLFTLEKKD